MRARVPVTVAGQHGLEQAGAGGDQRRAHRLLQHAQGRAGAEPPGGQPGQRAYLGGGDLIEPRREPSLCPPAGGEPVPAVTGRAAQIASLTWLTSSTSAANRWCSATSRSAFSSSGPGFRCTFTVLPPTRRVPFPPRPWPPCPR